MADSVIKNNVNGNSDTISRAYLDSLIFEERLIGSQEPDTSITLFGKKLSTPIMTAALSGFDRIGDGAALKMAEGVKKVNSIMWMGISEDKDVEAVAQTGVNLIEIIKPYEEESIIYRKIENDKKWNLTAIGMDVDHCFDKEGTGHFGHDRSGNATRTKTVEELKEYVKACEGIPFIAKGILSVRDAVLAAEAGVSAIVLSHHHNIYPFALPPVQLLPDIKKELGEDITIITDSNIADGFDACKALLLGSDGVCIGRPLQAQLIKNGEEGVYQYLSQATDQLRSIMARTGTADLYSKDASVLHRRTPYA